MYGFGVEMSKNKGFELFEQSAAGGNSVGQVNLGTCYYDRGPLEKAFELFQMSSSQGNVLGQAWLGICFRDGLGVDKDVGKALELFRKSATRNDPVGLCYLGLSYEYGLGVKRNAKKAFDLYLRAASQGYPRGEVLVGNCFEVGFWVEKDLVVAVAWYEKAVKGKSKTGVKRLAALYPHRAKELYISSYETYSSMFDFWLKTHLDDLNMDELREIYKVSERYNRTEDAKKIGKELATRKSRSHNYARLMKLLDVKDCCICYDKLREDKVFISACLHVFHPHCVAREITCPMCRLELKEINC
jgi:TPR repeat protein